MSLNKYLAIAVSSVVISGCVETPKVVEVRQPSDTNLSCQEMSRQLSQAYSYKADAEERDRFKGKYIFFPTGFVSWYNIDKARSAAEARISFLQGEFARKGCDGSGNGSATGRRYPAFQPNGNPLSDREIQRYRNSMQKSVPAGMSPQQQPSSGMMQNGTAPSMPPSSGADQWGGMSGEMAPIGGGMPPIGDGMPPMQEVYSQPPSRQPAMQPPMRGGSSSQSLPWQTRNPAAMQGMEPYQQQQAPMMPNNNAPAFQPPYQYQEQFPYPPMNSGQPPIGGDQEGFYMAPPSKQDFSAEGMQEEDLADAAYRAGRNPSDAGDYIDGRPLAIKNDTMLGKVGEGVGSMFKSPPPMPQVGQPYQMRPSENYNAVEGQGQQQQGGRQAYPYAQPQPPIAVNPQDPVQQYGNPTDPRGNQYQGQSGANVTVEHDGMYSYEWQQQ